MSLQSPDTTKTFEQTCIDTIRFLAVDAVQKANSGHPGMPMGMAPVAYALWTRHLKYDAAHPDWPDRDRFVLSAGHGSMLLYALLHSAGYDLSLDELALPQARQPHARPSRVPLTPGVETTTGPLGRASPTPSAWPSPRRFLAAASIAPDPSSTTTPIRSPATATSWRA